MMYSSVSFTTLVPTPALELGNMAPLLSLLLSAIGEAGLSHLL